MKRRDLDRSKRVLVEKRDEISVTIARAESPIPAAGGYRGDTVDQANANTEAELQIHLHQTDARGKRDRAMLALLLGCGLRRSELVMLKSHQVQKREDHWVIVDLVGKARHVRTVPIPPWVKEDLDAWTSAAGIREGKLFRSVRKNGAVWGSGVTQNVVWYVVKKCAQRAGIDRIAPHDLRRSCARLCHSAGGELEQIQFLLGHISVQTTERYVGCKQRLDKAVNDRIELGTAKSAELP